MASPRRAGSTAAPPFRKAWLARARGAGAGGAGSAAGTPAQADRTTPALAGSVNRRHGRDCWRAEA
eukprot:6183183-Pleurochrysis_carterae.AAC.3